MREESVKVPGATLWTETTGHGSEAVVLCHGGPGLSDNLAPVASMIEDRALVHRYDQRGGGRSTGTAPFFVADFIDDLEALRVHWKHDAWIVGGHSWGGWLAILYAIAHPDRVSGLIGIGVPPPPSAFHDKYWSERARRLGADELAFFDEINARHRNGEVVLPADERRGFIFCGGRSSLTRTRHPTSISSRSTRFQRVRTSVATSLRTWTTSPQLETCRPSSGR